MPGLDRAARILDRLIDFLTLGEYGFHPECEDGQFGQDG